MLELTLTLIALAVAGVAVIAATWTLRDRTARSTSNGSNADGSTAMYFGHGDSTDERDDPQPCDQGAGLDSADCGAGDGGGGGDSGGGDGGGDGGGGDGGGGGD